MNDNEKEMTIEELKRSWQSLNRRVEAIEQMHKRRVEDIINSRKLTSLQRIRRNYRVFIVWAAIMLFFCPVFFPRVDLIQPDRQWLIVVLWDLYFLTVLLMDSYLYRLTGRIDVYNQPVTEVRRLALRSQRLHQKFVLVLVPFAIIVIGLFAWSVIDSEDILIGMLFGGLIGSIVGITKYVQMMKSYRLITDDETDSEISDEF